MSIFKRIHVRAMNIVCEIHLNEILPPLPGGCRVTAEAGYRMLLIREKLGGKSYTFLTFWVTLHGNLASQMERLLNPEFVKGRHDVEDDWMDILSHSRGQIRIFTSSLAK